jgi:hypothetical protein
MDDWEPEPEARMSILATGHYKAYLLPYARWRELKEEGYDPQQTRRIMGKDGVYLLYEIDPAATCFCCFKDTCDGADTAGTRAAQ